MSGITSNALLLVLGNSGTLSWFPPVVVFSLVGLCFLLSIIFPFIWQWREKGNRINSEKVNAFLYGLIRYTIAFNLAGFGWKKLFGLQFVVPKEISDIPMNRQSGEWLTWFYFGHSYTFGLIIAIVQIGGACLLLFQRTVLFGSVILLSFMLHLTLINIFYQMNAGALLQSIFLTSGIVFLLCRDFDRLMIFFLRTKSGIPTISMNSLQKNGIRISAIILSLVFTLYLKSLMK